DLRARADVIGREGVLNQELEGEEPRSGWGGGADVVGVSGDDIEVQAAAGAVGIGCAGDLVPVRAAAGGEGREDSPERIGAAVLDLKSGVRGSGDAVPDVGVVRGAGGSAVGRCASGGSVVVGEEVGDWCRAGAGV